MRISLSQKDLLELIKFGLVGGICTAIDASVFYLLHQSTGYHIAIVAGFLLSISVNYLLNIYWSFGAKPSVKNAIGIFTAHSFNIFTVRFGLMWLFIEVFDLMENTAYIPTLIISVFTNFFIIRFVVNHYR